MMLNKVVLADLKDQDMSSRVHLAFEQAGVLPLIERAREIYIHVPLGAVLFHDDIPVGGTYLDVELAEAMISVCSDKKIVFYETPATAHKNIIRLFERFGYIELSEKYSNVRIQCPDADETDKDSVQFDYGFEYPPVKLPGFLFNKENLIISFSNPKAPFSESVVGFQGLPFSLSGKSLIIGSTLFPKKNLLHFALPDVGLGLQDYVADALNRMHNAGVLSVGINGGRQAGGLINNVKINPVDWNLLIVSANMGLADVVTAALMGFKPQNIGYFLNLVQKGLIPSDFSNFSEIEIGNGRDRLEKQLRIENPFLQIDAPITTRQWAIGLLSQLSLKERIAVAGRTIPSMIKYKLSRKKPNPINQKNNG